jgi:hypothetical protein
MASLLAPFIAAFEKLDGDDVSLQTEIDALKAQESAFEASIQQQAEASVNAALNTAGISPAQIQSMIDRISALEAADTDLNSAGSTTVSTSLPGVSTSLSNTVSTSLSSTTSSGVSSSISGVSTSLSSTAST